MIILYHKKFLKSYKRLPVNLKKKIDSKLQIFAVDPFSRELKNHKLKGSMQMERSISVTRDIRIIFEEYDKYTLVLMLDVGTHNKVYK